MSTKPSAERRKRFETSSGIDLPADFNPSNTEPIDYDKDLNSPGDFPYTRGIYSNMYRAGCGRCGSTRATPPPRNLMLVTNTCWRKAPPDYPSRSTYPLKLVLTQMIHS